jgi:hypothetical protein
MNMRTVGCEKAPSRQDEEDEEENYRNRNAVLLDLGEDALPFAPVHGCPEFVPSFYKSDSLTETIADEMWATEEELAKEKLAERKLFDTFVFESDPSSASVLGVDAQVLAVSLPGNMGVQIPTGAVSRVQLLYNVDKAPGFGQRGNSVFRLGGCQPIRAAGRKGHMRLQWVLEQLMATFSVQTEKNGYAAWLACLTADQRIAIVESPEREHWINMSMPYPMWTGKPTQAVWCPEEKAEACFEVWSNPNPNE